MTRKRGNNLKNRRIRTTIAIHVNHVVHAPKQLSSKRVIACNPPFNIFSECRHESNYTKGLHFKTITDVINPFSWRYNYSIAKDCNAQNNRINQENYD